MVPRKRETRIYWRGNRAWADFRDFAAQGGKREALIPPDGTQATDDPDIAAQLASDRVKELEGLRRDKVILGYASDLTVGEAGKKYLKWLEEQGRVRRHRKNVQKQLATAAEYFKPGRFLHRITVRDVKGYVSHLRTKGYAEGTVRHYLMALSGAFTWAGEEERVPPGFNPVGALRNPPTADRVEAAWLEIDAAAHYLESARLLPPEETPVPVYEITATYLLTGARMTEGRGLVDTDISFDRRVVRIQPNPWRRLKNASSDRTVPLWPQLAGILGPYMMPEDRPPRSGLLFGGPKMIREKVLYEALDAVAELARDRWPAFFDRPVPAPFSTCRVRPTLFRHTYTAARLQTLDHGKPVSVWTVSRELGHSSTERVERVYGHLGTIRVRGEAVEYTLPQTGAQKAWR